ncbi:MAG TPA: NAD-dependent epimerase/dehydratase family protein [Bacteroidales bacterium]|nr:NAD-dependent epimerase/dehydratase family protein [Bacteroidales bacterium]HRZ77452.1 NAD-dependent epimerase/dehydratase family protein [Bacteroidales bacterium]
MDKKTNPTAAADVLVTGSEGFIGSPLCRRLESEGYRVVGADLRLGHDLSLGGALDDFPDFRVAVHLAARTYIPDSLKDPGAFLRTNTGSTLQVLEACRRRGARMILASTYLYGVPQVLPVDEEHPLAAPHPYALSKQAAEALCRVYAQAGLVPVIIFRPFNVFGPGQDERFLLPSFLKQWSSGTVRLQDPEPRRDYLYIDDMVNAYMAAIRLPFQGLEVVNIGSGISYSVREVCSLLSSMMPGEGEVIFSGQIRENEIPETRAAIGKARELLGWQPEFSMEEGLRLTVEHFLSA